MKVWYAGKFIDVEIGQKLTVLRSTYGDTVFGESAKLVKATNQHLVIETETGCIVKTKVDNLYDVVGKAKANGYYVSIHSKESYGDKFIQSATMYWNEKKGCAEYK